ncbi:MAG: undecaprenyldiphospho-muramoylpentapeptide beta-N-acetylglucosaminyltransferase [Bacteroidia bacterium]
MKAPRVLVSGGGTGGHIFPAVAIANAIKEKYPASDIEFVGAKGRMEMEKVPAEGYKIHGLWISGLQRSLDWRNLILPFKLLSSLFKSFVLVKRFKPDITIGVGGYASGPLNYVSSSLGIPLLLQEQNSFPGLTNKLLKNKASCICVAYPGMDKYFTADKIVITGNPIRQNLASSDASKASALEHFGLDPSKKTVLIIGGSLGARSVNIGIEAHIENLQSDSQVLWQTGKSYGGETGSFEQGVKTIFIKRMDLAYRAADIVISRAGATSISELAVLSKACIFVPLPSAAEDHQTKNAQSLVDKNAALLCPDKQADDLINMANELLNDEPKIQALEREIKSFAKPHAAKEILTQIEKLIE